jgi:hypothetical protein
MAEIWRESGRDGDTYTFSIREEGDADEQREEQLSIEQLSELLVAGGLKTATVERLREVKSPWRFRRGAGGKISLLQ